MTSLAVMVDLGWPWWVTSLIAVAIVAGSGVVAFRTRSPVARAVAAVLIVEGIAIAGLAPAVMSSAAKAPSASTPAGMGSTASASSQPMSGSAFARAADANCAAVDAFAATLGNPTSPAGIASQLDRMMPAFWRAYGAQGAVRPPSAKRAAVADWMTAMAAVGSDLEALRSAAKSQDAAGMKAANAAAATHAAESARLSKQLGMKVCFS